MMAATLTVQQLLALLAVAPDNTPGQLALEAAIQVGLGYTNGNRYTSQKGHWQKWLNEKIQAHPHGNPNLGRIYRRINAPSMILFLAEVAEVDAGTINRATAAAITASKSSAAKAGAIRRVCPFDMVEVGLLKQIEPRRSA